MVGFLRGTEGLDSGSEALYTSHVRRGHWHCESWNDEKSPTAMDFLYLGML